MATSFDKIINVAMITIRDYKLDKIYYAEQSTFETILSGYVIRGVPKFESCLKPLNYDLETREFEADLDMYEIDILASWTVIEWYEDQLQDVLEFKEPLRDIDFNKYSTGQNLRPRQDYLSELRRKVKLDTTNYLFMHLADLPYWSHN